MTHNAEEGSIGVSRSVSAHLLEKGRMRSKGLISCFCEAKSLDRGDERKTWELQHRCYPNRTR